MLRCRCRLGGFDRFGIALGTGWLGAYFLMRGFDRAYGGIAEGTEEGVRLGKALGNHSSMIMANHGVLVASPRAWRTCSRTISPPMLVRAIMRTV